MALVLIIEVGWDETNKKIQMLTELVDADGHPVTSPGGPLGEQPVQLSGELETGRPVGMPAGTPIMTTLAPIIGPGLPLTPGERYQWRVSLNGKTKPEWCASFLVRS